MRFRNIDLRCVEIDGKSWFMANDIVAALDLAGYASSCTVKLANDEVRVISRDPIVSELFSATKAGKVSLVCEGGLYKLIMRSDNPEAEGFQHWVTTDVLPAIRKDGMSPDDFCEKSVSVFV